MKLNSSWKGSSCCSIWSKKKYGYCFECLFTILTDHKPLLGIIRKHKGISITSAAPIQRWSLFLLNYQYQLNYCLLFCRQNGLGVKVACYGRAYFRRIKHSGIRCFIKKCLFLKKKTFFLIWIKSVNQNFQLERIQPSATLLDNPRALLSNKGALLLKWRALFQEQFDSILHFK